MLYRVSTFTCRCIFKLFFGLEIQGREHFPKKGPFILASNHLSNLDPPVLASSAPRKVGFLAKQELFKNKFFALYLKDVGAVSLVRNSSDIKALRQAISILKEKPLLIFPQGSRERSLDEASSGVGFLAKRSKAPIVVAKISGTDRILPKGVKFFKKGKIKVKFSGIDNIDYNEDKEKITQKVIDKIKSL